MEEKDFIVNVGPGGTFRPSKSYQTLPEHVDAIFSRFEKNQVKKITLYFHGGLVNEKQGRKTAVKMAKHFQDTGQAPICFVWETGIIEILSANISKISGTKIFNKLVKKLTRRLSKKLGFDLLDGRGPGNFLSEDEIELELMKPIPFQNYTQSILETSGRGDEAISMIPQNEKVLLEQLEAEFTYDIQADHELMNAIAETELTINDEQKGQSRGIINPFSFIKNVAIIAFRVIKRFIKKRDHDFYPTIIEEVFRRFYIAEMGAGIWNLMKVKSMDMWNDNTGRSGLNLFAGRYLLDKLIDYAKNTKDVEFNLVGHSAGSNAICNLLNTTSIVYPKLVYNKIAFLAPACPIDQFNKEVVSNQTRFNKFRMYTMYDKVEVDDVLVPFVYTHSLLYLISGILENKGKDFDAYILGLERHIKGKHPYNSAKELKTTHKYIYEDHSNRAAFSKTISSAPVGMRTRSTSHGGFDDDRSTINSLKHFLNEA